MSGLAELHCLWSEAAMATLSGRSHAVGALLRTSICLVVACSAWIAAATGARAAGAAARIAYTRDDAIWTINPDGTGARVLVSPGRTGATFYAPQWSPDRTKLAFARGDRHNQIWTVGADGEGLRRLTSRGENSLPSWSPNGRWIVYNHLHAGYRGQSDLFRVHPWGGTPQRITRTRRRSEFAPRISPNGRWLLYSASIRGGFGLWISRRDGRHARLIVPPRFEPAGAAWRPDSRRIVFFTNSSSAHSVIMTVAPNGRGRHVLTRGPRSQNDNSPSYSPDGHRVVFMRFTQAVGRQTPPDLWVLTVRPHVLRRLTRTPHGEEQGPAWASG
jgi:Tol biopolymer transport system component